MGETGQRADQHGCPAPKEQPPRKLSGKRTDRARALWKAGAHARASHRRGKPRGRSHGQSFRFPDRGVSVSAIAEAGLQLFGAAVSDQTQKPLEKKPLYSLHVALRARMV